MKTKNKVILTIIFILAILFISATVSKGKEYETDTFKVNVPDSFITEKTQYTLASMNSNNTIALSIESSVPGQYENNGIQINELFMQYMENFFEETYGEGYEYISSNIIEQNGYKGMRLKFKDTSTFRIMYGEIYVVNSDNYVYVIMLGTQNESYLNSSEKNGIVNSFKVKDTVKIYNVIPFTDVKKSDWYYNSVKFNNDNKIIYGINDYTFNPNGKLTRGMLVTILWRMEGEPKVTGNQRFSDVKQDQYYYEAIKWAEKSNVVNGYEDGKFRPNNNITREQLATILMNYAKFKGKDTSQRTDLNKFVDNKGISSYAKDAISWAVAKKVISGKVNATRGDTSETAIRAEAAAMIANYCNYVGR